jgi:ABC-2 type transport system ATP-binding protein
MEEAQRLCDRVAILDHGRVVDMGTPAELVKRHCPERTVIVTTDDTGAAGRLNTLSHGISVTAEPPRIAFRGSGDDLVTLVVQMLAEHRIRVLDLSVEQPTLEDVFLRLTGHGIRD